MSYRSLPRIRILVFISGCVLLAILFGLQMKQGTTGVQQDEAVIQFFLGMSDASAAVVLSDEVFVMADDESNVLRYYKKACEHNKREKRP